MILTSFRWGIVRANLRVENPSLLSLAARCSVSDTVSLRPRPRSQLCSGARSYRDRLMNALGENTAVSSEKARRKDPGGRRPARAPRRAGPARRLARGGGPTRRSAFDQNFIIRRDSADGSNDAARVIQPPPPRDWRSSQAEKPKQRFAARRGPPPSASRCPPRVRPIPRMARRLPRRLRVACPGEAPVRSVVAALRHSSTQRRRRAGWRGRRGGRCAGLCRLCARRRRPRAINSSPGMLACCLGRSPAAFVLQQEDLPWRSSCSWQISRSVRLPASRSREQRSSRARDVLRGVQVFGCLRRVPPSSLMSGSFLNIQQPSICRQLIVRDVRPHRHCSRDVGGSQRQGVLRGTFFSAGPMLSPHRHPPCYFVARPVARFLRDGAPSNEQVPWRLTTWLGLGRFTIAVRSSNMFTTAHHHVVCRKPFRTGPERVGRVSPLALQPAHP